MLQLNAKEARIALLLMGQEVLGQSVLRPGNLTAEDALALKERLRAFVKEDGE